MAENIYYNKQITQSDLDYATLMLNQAVTEADKSMWQAEVDRIAGSLSTQTPLQLGFSGKWILFAIAGILLFTMIKR